MSRAFQAAMQERREQREDDEQFGFFRSLPVVVRWIVYGVFFGASFFFGLVFLFALSLLVT